MGGTRRGVLILVLVNVLLWLPLLLQGGIIIQRDFNFPVYPENFVAYHYPTWNHLMSQPTFEQMIRIPMRLPYLLLAALGVDVSMILKLLIVGTTSFLSVSMFVFLSELRAYSGVDVSDFTMLALALLFAFNPISLQFLGGISLLFSVGALPLLQMVAIRYASSPLRFSLLSALLLLLSLGHPFVFLMNSLIWAVFTLVVDGSLRKSVVKVAGVGLLFLGFSAWYFLPYLSNAVSSVSMGRAANVAYSTFRVVSENNALKIFLLERDRFLYVHTHPESVAGTLVHFLALALILVISLLPAVRGSFSGKGRKMYLLSLTGYVLSVLFALGEKSVIGGLYYRFISSTPIGWTFRSPLKFQLYEMFFLVTAFALGFDALCPLVRKPAGGISLRALSSLFLVFILAGSVGYGVWDVNYNSFNPVPLPQQFYEINSLLESLNDPYRVMWYPRYNERPTVWSERHYVSPFDMKSSRKPTYNTYWNYNYVNAILYDYPYSKGVFVRDYFYTFLRSVGVGYIAFHNDRNLSVDERFLRSVLGRGVTVYSRDGWYLVALNSTVNDYVFVPSCLVGVWSLKDVYRLASPSTAPVNFTELSDPMTGRVLAVVGPSGRILNVTSPNLAPNPSFGEWENGSPVGWNLLIDTSLTNVSRSCAGQDCVLWVSTERSYRKTWDFIASDPLEVLPGEKYLITGNLSIGNLSGVHVKVDYYNGTSGRWELLSLVPLRYQGEDGWSQYWGTVDVPEGVSRIRVVIASGWTDEGNRGLLLVKDVGLYRLYPCPEEGSVSVDYVHDSPTRVEVSVNSSRPFLLALNEVYDPGWVAKVYANGTLVGTVRPVRIYGFTNGFWIDTSGRLEVVIEYRPQKLFELGLIVSLLTGLAVVVLAYVNGRKGERGST